MCFISFIYLFFPLFVIFRFEKAYIYVLDELFTSSIDALLLYIFWIWVTIVLMCVMIIYYY
jgi:hypothetical protein